MNIKRVSTNFGGILFLSLSIIIVSATNGGAVVLPSNSSSWFINMNSFAKSAHGTFTCETCHDTMKEGNKKHPDPEDIHFLKKVASRIYDYSRCKSCHHQSFERYLLGEHAKELKEEQESPSQKEGMDSK